MNSLQSTTRRQLMDSLLHRFGDKIKGCIEGFDRIEENTKHLTAQKDMLKFALKRHQQNKENIKKKN